MARNGNLPITDRILAIRERWHTKRHPFFLAFGEGKLPLRALGRYQALHYHFVSRALASFGMLYARGYHFEDVRKMIAENIAEEEGLKAIPEPGHEPHDHNELILRFCRAAGLSDEEVRNTKMPPAWWARSLYMYHTTANEPVGVILAMQTTQEGQMPGLISEVPAAGFREALRVQSELAGDRILHRARCCRCRAQPPPDRAVRQVPRHAAAQGARRASGRGNLRIALGLDLRALSIGNAGREGDPAAGGYQITPARRARRGSPGCLSPRRSSGTKANATAVNAADTRISGSSWR